MNINKILLALMGHHTAVKCGVVLGLLFKTNYRDYKIEHAVRIIL